MNNMNEDMLGAMHQYQSDKQEIIRHFNGNRMLAIEAIRRQARSSRCTIKVAASILLASIRSEPVASGVDAEDMQAIQRHENDR